MFNWYETFFNVAHLPWGHGNNMDHITRLKYTIRQQLLKSYCIYLRRPCPQTAINAFGSAEVYALSSTTFHFNQMTVFLK